VPWLASSHTVSDDGLTWDFRLRPGVNFHDGSDLTADDGVYSFHRVLALKLAAAGAFLPILKPENMTAPDRLSVRFVLSKPYAPFFAAIPIVSIINPRVIKANEKDGAWARRGLPPPAPGSGADKIVPATYRPLESLDLEIQRPLHGVGGQQVAGPQAGDAAGGGNLHRDPLSR
jgi:peptide/nickel transport system substrate-binding protein